MDGQLPDGMSAAEAFFSLENLQLRSGVEVLSDNKPSKV